ncbi:unnamed protein product [Rotaria sp. Silwood2]|nr:unnamed protein product [Rotaria sp. Silwood2]CAF2504353.1 unnamed protein product [Rotaria sp. Silwood2]CAF2902353.1 unnamed protein product [Rotaria sp. Silwood2]CAF4002406.1 unnamed protein product [Rotaria sp. Silwood2]CAF4616519.1 unnamed protein product [Rotaria sp. Silwood2]
MGISVGTMIMGRILDDQEDLKESKSFELDLTQPVIPFESPQWGNYVVGVLALFLELPIGSGLSSSASIEVAMSLLCCKAEQTYGNVPCGIMNQYTSCLAKADHVILIDCQNNTSRYVLFNDKNLCILVTNSNVKYDLVSEKFAENVGQCQYAAKILGHQTLRDVASIDEFKQARDKMSPVTYRRAHYVITEMQRTQAGAQALENRDYNEFSHLMYESHESLRKYFEVSCVELDQLVDLARSVDGVFGSRMTGAGFGSCTVTLVKKSSIEKCMKTINNNYKDKASFLSI